MGKHQARSFALGFVSRKIMGLAKDNSELKKVVCNLPKFLVHKAPEKAEPRGFAVEAILEIVKAMEVEDQSEFVDFVMKMGQGKSNLRILAVDLIPLMMSSLGNPFGSVSSEDSVEDSWGLGCVNAFVQRCSDSSALIRARALSNLAQVVGFLSGDGRSRSILKQTLGFTGGETSEGKGRITDLLKKRCVDEKAAHYHELVADLKSLLDTDDDEILDRFYVSLSSTASPFLRCFSAAMDSPVESGRLAISASEAYLSLLLSTNCPVFTFFSPVAFLSLLGSIRRYLKPRHREDSGAASQGNKKKRGRGGGSRKNARNPGREDGDETEEGGLDAKLVFRVLERLGSVLGFVHLDRFPDSLKSLVQTVSEIPLLALEHSGVLNYDRLMEMCGRILGGVLSSDHGDVSLTAAEISKSLTPLLLMGKHQARSFALGFVSRKIMGLAKDNSELKKVVCNLPKFLVHKAPEKAEPRGFAVEAILEIVKAMEVEDQSEFVDFVMKMGQGKSNLRILAVDLVPLMMSSLGNSFGSISSEDGVEDSWGLGCLNALVQRCSDSSALIRARALSNLAQVVGFLSGDERSRSILKQALGFTGGETSEGKGRITDLLKKRCVDEKAATRRAALLLVTKLTSLLGGCFDVSILKTMGTSCSDPLISIRKAAISALSEVDAHVKALKTLCVKKARIPEESDVLVKKWVEQVLSKASKVTEKYIEGISSNNLSFATPAMLGSRRSKKLNSVSKKLSKAITAVYTIGSCVIIYPSADTTKIVPLLHTVITSGSSDSKLKNKLPQANACLKQKAPSLYSQSWLTMAKICLADGKLAKRYIPLFAQLLDALLLQELEKSDCAALRNNLVVAMTDFCVHYTAMIECYIPKITKRLRDPCEVVRRQTFILLSRLLQRDYVKWRGVLFLGFLLSLVDESEKIRRLADFLFGNILKVKAPLLAYNSFVEAIYVLNDCHAHNGHNNSDAKQSRTKDQAFSIRGNDERARSKRMQIYVDAHVKALKTLCVKKARIPEESDVLVKKWVEQVLSKASKVTEKYIEGISSNNLSFATPAMLGSRRSKKLDSVSKKLSKAITAVYTIGSCVIIYPSADTTKIVPLLHTVITSGSADSKLKNKLPQANACLKQKAPPLYSQSWLTMAKICLADGKLAKRYIPLFAQELEKSDCAALRNNLVVAMTDFCVHYTAMIECYIPKITKRLRDPCEVVRRQTFILLSRLLQRDYVKWRGVLFLRFLLSLVDESEKIRRLADFLFGNILKVKAPLLAYNSFVEAIYVLNDCHAHNGHNNSDAKQSRTKDQAFSIRGNDERACGTSHRSREPEQPATAAAREENVRDSGLESRVVSAAADAMAAKAARSVLREVNGGAATPPLSAMSVPKLRSSLGGGKQSGRPSADVLESLRRRPTFMSDDDN
ncbi:hypothetical protein F2Q70_00032644 [Brassica cretica]|uniref:Condensin-2 complex subunit n=1 Tax=Brassica cretica TaxID=69181 RepID=A0A8S9FB99_BRACR|nr:hypothetical protein F2Q70_00032644 [Brassica cretica]